VADLANCYITSLCDFTSEQKPRWLHHMRGAALNICLGLLTFAVTLYFLYPSEIKQCTIILTGESIRLVGCDLTPEHITAVANLKVLSAPLGVQACD
jgi:hypothetical protein